MGNTVGWFAKVRYDASAPVHFSFTTSFCQMALEWWGHVTDQAKGRLSCRYSKPGLSGIYLHGFDLPSVGYVTGCPGRVGIL